MHGEDSRASVRSVKGQDAPRATSATDLAQVAPVLVREQTIAGDDPYNAAKPRVRDGGPIQTAKADWTPAPRALPVGTPEAQVRRAQPVGPLDHPEEQPKVELPPPEPVDLNDDPTTL